MALKLLDKYGAALLCGGQSKRMGFDKALYLSAKDGHPLILNLAENLSHIFGSLILVTDHSSKFTDIPELSQFTLKEDLHPLAGPAGAIHTALENQSGPGIFVMACDMPIIDLKIIEQLAFLMEKTDAEIVLPRHNQHCEPLYGFYRQSTKKLFQQSLALGRRSIRDTLALANTIYLDLKEEDLPENLFKNLNTKEDLKREGYPVPKKTTQDK